MSIANPDYEEPACHDILFMEKKSNSVKLVARDIDRCLVKHFDIADIFETSWFRCVTRRPSGMTGFTPNSMKAVFSRVSDNGDHLNLARDIVRTVCGNEDVFVPYTLLRLHMLNVLTVNMVMAGSTNTVYSRLYANISSESGDGPPDGLWHILNVAGSLYMHKKTSEIRTFISALLDAWLIARAFPETSDSITQTMKLYWDSLMKHNNLETLFEVEDDVGQPLLDIWENVYSNGLMVDVTRITKQMSGMRDRIARLDAVLETE